jgi:DNA-binding transcriptional LysR family regulator
LKLKADEVLAKDKWRNSGAWGGPIYDRLMQECFYGDLKSPNIVQEEVDEATILSLVLHGVGVAFVTDNARWRCPKCVIILPVTDLVLTFPLSLAWRKNKLSPLLANFVEVVRQLLEVKAFAKRRVSQDAMQKSP